jgi:signal transduction histidine kinase
MKSALISHPDTKPYNYLHSLPSTVTSRFTKIIQDQPGQFSPVLAHEIRNPLSNILLAAEMLKSQVIDDYHKSYLDIIVRGSTQINNIITELLTSIGGGKLKPEKHSVHQLLDETLAMAADRLLLKNITVTKEYTAKDCIIAMNRSGMKMALTNIIINAIDAMPLENGHLKLVTRSMNGKCVIEIEDNGTGISKENLKKIFKPFFTNKPGGMGIGLSATRDILLSNHATVKVQSEEGKGTRFILLFGNKSISPFTAKKRPGLYSKIMLVPVGE